MIDRLKKIFTDLGFTSFTENDGWCPKSTILNINGDRKALANILKFAFDSDSYSIFLDDVKYKYVFSDMSNYGRHSNRLTIYK